METSTVLLSLRANVRIRDSDFGDVFLDRAKPHGMSERDVPFLSIGTD